jgi:hypothetical protein
MPDSQTRPGAPRPVLAAITNRRVSAARRIRPRSPPAGYRHRVVADRPARNQPAIARLPGLLRMGGALLRLHGVGAAHEVWYVHGVVHRGPSVGLASFMGSAPSTKSAPSRADRQAQAAPAARHC